MIEALQFDFMQHALAAGLLASVICGIMGTLVVVNRIVFLSGGIAHAAYGESGWRCTADGPIYREPLAFLWQQPC
jgi:zinc transport system permease protein